MFSRAVFFVSCFLAPLLLRAIGAAPAMHHYSVSDGLPSHEVHCIFQDSHGKIWFGTDVGVSCYNGVTFTNYSTRDGLPDHTIFGISEDRHGRIWFRAFNGLLSWFDGTKIVQPAVNAQLRQKLKANIVLSEELDEQDTLWIGMLNKNSFFKIPPGYANIIEQPLGDDVFYLKEIRKGQLFAAYGLKGGNLIYEGLHQPAWKIDTSFVTPWPIASTYLANGDYVMQYGRKRFRIRGNHCFMQQDSSMVTYSCADRGNDFWLCGPRPGGARLVRPGKDKDSLLLHYLPDYHVTSCMRDHEGGLWFGTLGSGVFYIPFPEMKDVYTLPLETDDRITAMTAWPNGGVVAGSLRGNFFRIENGNCTAWNDALLASMKSICCMSTIGSDLLIGGSQNSVIYHSANGKSTRLVNEYDTTSRGKLTLKCALAYDAQRWCAASIRSLMWIDRRTGKIDVLLQQLPERITSIAHTRGDTLWLGGLTRLWMFIPGHAPVDWSTHYPILAQHADELVGDTVDGTLWMLSRSSGVYTVTASGVTDLNALQPGLPLTCRELLLNQSLWIGSSNGLWELPLGPGNKTPLRTFDQSNGFPAQDIDALCLARNRIWLAGENTIFSFDPELYPRNTVPPQVCFRGIFCNGNLHLEDDPDQSNTFHYDENTFRFQLAGQSYKTCGHTKFLVYLEGIDKTWRETEESDITYYSLPPGDYRFMAYALNNNNVSSLKPVTYAFTVLPPFWQRSWFITGICVLAVFTVIWLTRAYQLRFRREERYRRSLAELEITAIRAQMNPHFIFNAINSIYNVVQTGERTASASYVARFARLIRNVLEFAPLKQIPLEREVETLRLYMDIEQLRFREAFDYTISIDPQLNVSTVQVVPMLLQPYVENAIWHGLLHKEGKGTISISIRKEEQSLVCIIEDNGIGRARAALEEHHDLPKNPLSNLLNQRRLELLRELYGIAFEVCYVDLFDPQNATETGTRVILHIPATLNPSA